MILFSFIRLLIKLYENIKVTIEDYVMVFIMIPFLFTILWVQVAATYYIENSAIVSVESTTSNLLYSQFGSIVLILVLYFIPQRLSRQKQQNETNDDLLFAHQLLKKSYDPLKFVQRNLTKFISADELQEIPKSIMLNTIVAQCTTAIAAYENSVGNSSNHETDRRERTNFSEFNDDVYTFVTDSGFEINLIEESSEISSITFNNTEYELTKMHQIEQLVKVIPDIDNIASFDIDGSNIPVSK